MPSAAPPIVLVIMGVAGTGKSTVAGMLAERLRLGPARGDDLHPAEQCRKDGLPASPYSDR